MRNPYITEEIEALGKMLDGNRQIASATCTVLWEERRTYDRLGDITGHLMFWDASVMCPYGRPGGSCFVLTMFKSSSDNTGDDVIFKKTVLEDGMCIKDAIDTARSMFDEFVDRSIRDNMWLSRG